MYTASSANKAIHIPCVVRCRCSPDQIDARALVFGPAARLRVERQRREKHECDEPVRSRSSAPVSLDIPRISVVAGTRLPNSAPYPSHNPPLSVVPSSKDGQVHGPARQVAAFTGCINIREGQVTTATQVGEVAVAFYLMDRDLVRGDCSSRAIIRPPMRTNRRFSDHRFYPSRHQHGI